MAPNEIKPTESAIEKYGNGASIPIFRSVKSFVSKFPADYFYPIIAVFLALIIGGILMIIIGANPFHAYRILWNGVAGGKYQIGLVLVKSIPLIMSGLGLSLTFRSGLFNIGSEGQIFIGGLAGTLIVLWDPGLPGPIIIIMAILAAFIAGGLWAAQAGYLKARFGINEIISTLLLNYIAIWLMSYFVAGPIKEDKTSEAALPQTAQVPVNARLPIIWEGTQLHLGLIITILAAIIMFFVLFRTSFGYKARAVGFSQAAASYAGISVIPMVVIVMLISGGMAGIAGIVEVLGVQRRLREDFLLSTGYTSIAVALLGKNHPFGIVLAGIFFGALEVGAIYVESLAGVPSVIVTVIQATVIFFVAVGIVWESNPISQLLRKRTKLKG